MVKISGTVEARSANGIMLQGTWYNATEKTMKFLDAAAKGDVVELDVDGNQINFIKLNKGAFPLPLVIPNIPANPQPSRLEYLKTCLKDANNLMKEALPAAELTPNEYAELVVKLAITLWIDKR
jgi:hypothetical protein